MVSKVCVMNYFPDSVFSFFLFLLPLLFYFFSSRSVCGRSLENFRRRLFSCFNNMSVFFFQIMYLIFFFARLSYVLFITTQNTIPKRICCRGLVSLWGFIAFLIQYTHVSLTLFHLLICAFLFT